MTREEWHNLKIGDRLLCVYDLLEGKMATVAFFDPAYCLGRSQLTVHWDDGTSHYLKWGKYTSFDLINKKEQELNLFNGGAIL